MNKVFKTLAIIPLLSPIWEVRPPKINEIQTEKTVKAEDDAILFQAEGMQYVGLEMQLKFIHNLAATNNEKAAELLLRFVEENENNDLMVVALSQLSRLPIDREQTARTLFPLLTHQDRRIRYWSNRLMADLPIVEENALSAIIETASQAPAVNIRNTAMQTLRKHAHQLSFNDILHLTETENIRARNNAWSVAASTKDAADHEELLLQAVATDPSPTVRRALVMTTAETSFKLGHSIRHQAFTDPHSSVRSAAAKTASFRNQDEISKEMIDQDQVLLLALSIDDDAEVRRTAVESLSIFSSETVVSAVVDRFIDESGFVRRQAEESIVALAGRIETADIIAGQLESDNQHARKHAYNALGRTNAKQYSKMIYENLTAEERPANIVAVINALSNHQYHEALSAIAQYYDHESKIVREAVAVAFGTIGDSSINEKLARLIHDDESSVRLPAITSGGQLGDSYFSPYLLTIMQNVGERIRRFDTEDRIAVCWAAPRLDPISQDLMYRIYLHATREVVWSNDGYMHDASEVMVAALLAFAEAARREPIYAERMKVFFATFSDLLKTPYYDEQVLVSPILGDIIRQAEALYSDDRAIEPKPAPVSRPMMIYEPYHR